jgi:RHS repeat-associated protein
MQGVTARHSTAVANGGEFHAGKFIVPIRRVDVKLRANGGFDLACARQYDNLSYLNTKNTSGHTILGPRWHFCYDMHLAMASGTQDMLLYKSVGHGLILYRKTATVWEGDALNGCAVTVTLANNEFTMTQTDDQIVYKFASDGKLLSMRGANGNLLKFTYDANRLLTRIDLDHENPALDIDTRYVTLSYDTFTTCTSFPGLGAGSYVRLKRITGNDGRYVEYLYDQYRMLQYVMNSRGEVVEQYQNTIGTPHGTHQVPLVTRIFAPANDGVLRSTRLFFYNEQNCCLEVKDGFAAPIAQLQVLDMSGSNYRHLVTHGDGRKTLYFLDINRNPVRTIEYDASGNVTATREQTFVPNPALMRESRLPRATYDENGTTATLYEYLADGMASPTAADRLHVKSVTHTDGSKTEYEYDAKYRVTAVKQPLNRVTRYTYDASGNRTSMTDPAGNTWYYTYDAWGRLVRTEDPTSATTQMGYNTIGLVTATTDTEGRAATYQYNTIGLKTSATALGVTTSYAYDSRDQLTTVTDGAGNRTVTEYDIVGRRKAVTDPLGNRTRYAYDEYNNLRNVIDAADGWTTYTYDRWGRLTRFTDQRTKSTNYTYDGEGRLIGETNPLNQTTSYTYVAAGCGSCGSGGTGKLRSVTDPAGRITWYEYDLMGRMKKITWSGTTDYVEFTYDAAGRRTAMLDTRLPSADLGGQTYSWAHDVNDRVTTETWPGGSTIVTGYDKLGRRTSLRDPDGNVTAYSYSNTATNRKLGSIQHPFSGTTYYGYDAKGLLSTEEPSQGAGTWYEYDSLNRVSAIAHGESSMPSCYHREAYTYNAASMRTRIDYSFEAGGEWVPSSYKLYNYDALLRLTEEHKRSADDASLYRYAYTYDAAGNRTQLVNFTGSATQTTTYQYNNGNQLTSSNLSGVGTSTYSYDSNGNMVYSEDPNIGASEYNHNRENRLVRYDRDDFPGDVSYTYDALGRRIMRTDPQGNKVRYWYDGLGILLTKEKPSGASAWRTKQVYTLKQAALGHIISERTNTAWNAQGTATAWGDKWFHFDLLGNTTGEIGPDGSVATQVDMEAFGTVLSGGQNGYRLTTKQYDPDAGLYYFNARWYQGNLGVWLSADPSGFVGGFNLYVFVKSSPIVLFDTNGLQPEGANHWNSNDVPGIERAKDAVRDAIKQCRGLGLFPCGTKANDQCICMQKVLTASPFYEEVRNHVKLFRANHYTPGTGGRWMHSQCQVWVQGYPTLPASDTGYWGTTDTWSGPLIHNGDAYNDPILSYPL